MKGKATGDPCCNFWLVGKYQLWGRPSVEEQLWEEQTKIQLGVASTGMAPINDADPRFRDRHVVAPEIEMCDGVSVRFNGIASRD